MGMRFSRCRPIHQQSEQVKENEPLHLFPNLSGKSVPSERKIKKFFGFPIDDKTTAERNPHILGNILCGLVSAVFAYCFAIFHRLLSSLTEIHVSVFPGGSVGNTAGN